jgi:hypothetical protein
MPIDALIAGFAMFGTFSIMLLMLRMLKVPHITLPPISARVPVVAKEPLRDYRFKLPTFPGEKP